MQNYDFEPIPVSDLPGPAVLRPQRIGGEQRGRHGGKRGLSRVVVTTLGDRTLEVAHYATPVLPDWIEIANQRLYVWARFVDDRAQTLAGAEFHHPFVNLPAVDYGELEHPELWFSNQTNLWDESLHGHGIASALYAHLRLFEYDITQSPVLMGDSVGAGNGVGLWRRLDPTYDDDVDARQLRTAIAEFTDAKRNEIAARFAPDPEGEDFHLRRGVLDRRHFGFYGWP